MILTVTLNPSVDILYQIDHLVLDQVNRTDQVTKSAGGKGLNVARVAHLLGEEVSATGFIGGVLGSFIEEQLQTQGITACFTPILQETRNCIAIMHEGKQTELLEAGPEVSLEETTNLLQNLQMLLPKVQVITLSGSLPKGLSTSFYKEVLPLVKTPETKVILDTSGQALKDVVLGEVLPDVIKPNQDELGELLGVSIEESSSIPQLIETSVLKDVPVVFVTLGAKGALVKWQEMYYQASIPKVDVINPVGSGDSTVAGLAVALKQGLDPEASIKTAMCAGILNAMSQQTGWIDQREWDQIFTKIIVKKYKKRRDSVF